MVPDGQVLTFVKTNPTSAYDIWLLSNEDDGTPSPFLATSFNENSAMFSPNGRWLAHDSDETGRVEVYVQPYPGPGARVQVSTGGGVRPVWSRDGRELFYRDGDQMMTVSVATSTAGSTFTAGKPRLLFEGRYAPYFDVSLDGQQFLMIREESAGTSELHIVLDWFEELKRLVPTDN